MAIPTTGIQEFFIMKIYLAFAGSGNLNLLDLARIARPLASYRYDKKNLKEVKDAHLSCNLVIGNFTRGILDPGRGEIVDSSLIFIPKTKNLNFQNIVEPEGIKRMKIYLAGNGAMSKEQREELYNPPAHS